MKKRSETKINDKDRDKRMAKLFKSFPERLNEDKKKDKKKKKDKLKENGKRKEKEKRLTPGKQNRKSRRERIWEEREIEEIVEMPKKSKKRESWEKKRVLKAERKKKEVWIILQKEVERNGHEDHAPKGQKKKKKKHLSVDRIFIGKRKHR